MSSKKFLTELELVYYPLQDRSENLNKLKQLVLLRED